MAHTAQWDFIQMVKNRFPQNFADCRVLEVGSLDINGSVRHFFTNCFYIGLDVGPGSCVDIVCEGQNYNAPSESFDTIISCECFEHNPHWQETFANMIRLTKPGGMILFSCATEGRAEHGTIRTDSPASPLTIEKGWGEYYQNLTQKDFESVFDFSQNFSVHGFSTNTDAFDLYFWGIRRRF